MIKLEKLYSSICNFYTFVSDTFL